MNVPQIGALALLAACWSAFALSHSLLAGQTLERWCGRYSRIVFNLIAVLALALPVGVLLVLPAHALWQEPAAWRWALDGLLVLAALGFLHTLKYYSLPGFLGLRHETWPLTFSPWHCWVRHPWYFLMLVMVWSRPMTDTWLVTAVCVTLYLVVGSRIEERRILRYHPGSYAAYRQIVPGLLPWKGRALDHATRIRLEAQAVTESSSSAN
jgi:protein-S-isoprenylcysteine O-methyltransferase Ste14